MEQEKLPSDQPRKFKGRVLRRRQGRLVQIAVVVQTGFTEEGRPRTSLQATTLRKGLKELPPIEREIQEATLDGHVDPNTHKEAEKQRGAINNRLNG